MTRRGFIAGIVAVVLSFTFPTGIVAQSAVSGTVADSVSGKPLAGATVSLVRGGRTVVFGRTDGKGRFSVSATPQQGDLLQASLMGYARKRQPVAVDGSGNRILMTVKEFELHEVSVQGPPVTQRRDTITYDLADFANDRDNNLKDVLKKLPGVDVSQSGQISYNGKALSRFTVEGLDLSHGQYNKLTENIRAKDVKKAEVVEHDQPVKALRNRVFTDDVAMNIVLKDSARDQIAVTLRPYVFAGEPTHVGGDAVALQIGKKRQMEYSAQYDRTGRDLNNQFSLFYTLADFAPAASLTHWYNVPSLQSPIDAERMRRNTSQAYSVDLMSKGTNDAENGFSASYNRSVVRQYTQNVSQYFLDGSTPVETAEDRFMTLRQDVFSMDYNHRINAETHYGNIVVKADARQDDGLTNMPGRATQRVRTPEANVKAAVTQTWTFGKRLLQWKSTADYHHSKDALYLWDDGSETTRRVKNTIGTNLWHSDNSVGISVRHFRWSGDYAVNIEAGNMNADGADNGYVSGGLAPLWKYKDDDWLLTLSPGISVQRYTRQQVTMLLPSASAYVRRNYGNRREWSLVAGYSERGSGLEILAIDCLRTDYRTWSGAPDFVPRTRTLNTFFCYNYKRAIYQFFANARVGYVRQWLDASRDMVVADGNYYYSWQRHHSNTGTVNAQVDASKGWHAIRLKTNLAVTGTYSTGQQYSADNRINYSFVSYGLKPEIIYSPSWLEVSYRGNFQFNRSKSDGAWNHTLADWTQRLGVTSTINKVDLTLSAVLYHNEIEDSPSVNTLLADAKAVWRIGKVRLSASLRNIFDRRTYATTTYSGVGIFTNRYQLSPRELMVSVQFGL